MFTERSKNAGIRGVASKVRHSRSVKCYAIFCCSAIWFHVVPPQIRHNVSGGCPPNAFLCSIGAINPHTIPGSNSLGLNEVLDGSMFLGRCHQSQTSAYWEAVRLGHRTMEETKAWAVDKAPANTAYLELTTQYTKLPNEFWNSL